MRQNLAKYEGSASLSSAQLFGTGEVSSSSASYSSGPDLQDIKDGVKQGVSKVAGKISNLANGVMSSIQVGKTTSLTEYSVFDIFHQAEYSELRFLSCGFNFVAFTWIAKYLSVIDCWLCNTIP